MEQPEISQKSPLGRIRPLVGDLPRSTPPVLDGYQLRAQHKFQIVAGSIVGFVLLPFWWVLYSVVVGALGGRYIQEMEITFVGMLIGVLIALIAVPLLHEAVHGIAAMLIGIKPSYGIGLGFAYTTFPDPVAKWPYLTIGLAPLLVLSAIGIPLAIVWDYAAPAIIFFLVINAAGAIGDLWMSWKIAFQPADALFVDLADGFAVYVPDRTGLARRSTVGMDNHP